MLQRAVYVLHSVSVRTDSGTGRSKIYDAQVAQIPNANPVEVTVNAASNSLMVVADAEAMQRFVKVMDELQR